MRRILYIYLMTMLFCLSCNSFSEELDPDIDEVLGGESALGVGFDSFGFELPLLSRFCTFVEQNGGEDVDIEFYMRGRTDFTEYTLSATLTLGDEALEITSQDSEALAQLPHQEYFINYMIRSGATRSSEEENYPEGAVVIGAILSAVSADEVYFISTFSEGVSTSGSGTQEDPYIIANEDNFQEYIIDNMHNNQSDLSGLYFQQSADLNFSTKDVGCIGETSQIYFAGHYDGGMMTISQLTISSTSNLGTGLFYGIAEGGVFCNAIFDKSTVKGDEYVGMVASRIIGGEILHVFINSGCSVTGTGGSIGGFVGAGCGTLSTCAFRGSVTSEMGYCGGLIGRYYDFTGEDNTLTLQNCVFSGSLKCNGSRGGGFIGDISSCDFTTIDGAYICGTIDVTGDFVGGLIGHIGDFYSLKINNANIGYSRSTDDDTYVLGSPYESILNFECDDSDYVGGLVGDVVGDLGYSTANDSFVYVTDSRFSDNSNVVVEGSSNVGGGFGRAMYVHFRSTSYTNNATIEAISNTGGVFGDIFFSSFNDCNFYNYGNVNASGSLSVYTGGIIGSYYTTADEDGNSLGLYNYGNVTASSTSYVGGCIGYIENDDDDLSDYIIYVNYGAVTGSDNVGGFVGRVQNYPGMKHEYNVHKCGDEDSSYSVYIAGGDEVGGLFGKWEISNIAIENIYIYGKVTATITASGSDTGGLVGLLYFYETTSDKTIYFYESDSIVVVDGKENVGGVIGLLQSYLDKNITMTIQASNIISDDDNVLISGTKGVGGVVGSVYQSHSYNWFSKVRLNYCYNQARVKASDTGAGGVLGTMTLSDDTTLEMYYCCNWGAVESAAETSCAAGIVGYIDSGYVADITACYNGGDISGNDRRGGVIGSIDALAGSNGVTMESCFNMGSVANSNGSQAVAGLVGYVVKDGNDQKLEMKHCYNIGTTGWGSLGGDEDLKNADLDNSNNYYLNTASSGDLNYKHDDDAATSLTASQMAGGSMSLNSSYYTTPSNMKTTGDLPYISNIIYYKSRPKVAL